jgi:hypothetical protein
MNYSAFAAYDELFSKSTGMRGRLFRVKLVILIFLFLFVGANVFAFRVWYLMFRMRITTI